MDLRTQTSLIAAILTLAIGGSVLMRARRRVHWLFGAFALSIATWYSTTFVGGVATGSLPSRLNLVCAIAVPFVGAQFFRSFVPGDHRGLVYLTRTALVGAVAMVVVILTPLYDHIVLKGALFVHVTVMLFASLWFLWTTGARVMSRFEGARLRYLALVGALATVFTLADYLPYMGLDIPPVGTVLILVFLYVLSQSILRYRLLDLYELAGRLSVLTALSFTLAVIFWVLVEIAGGRFFLHSVVAALVVLLLFDPVRAKVEEKIGQFFFRERYDLEKAIGEARSQLAHVLEIDDLTRLLMDGLERSRRVTHAACYLVEEDRRGYSLAANVGPPPLPRLELAPARPLLDRLARDPVILVENVERELEERRESGEDREAETLFEVLQTLEALQASVCVGIKGESGDVYGLLCVRDDRLRDAYSPEEVQLLRGLANQAAIAVDNSRLYQRLKERDRLAALGEMAAGLAHEIRNPLGAIKASAQFLSEDAPPSTHENEFLDIIVEEVDRLNRVVGSFLDYARPSKGDPAPTDLNPAVMRTMQLLGPECQAAAVTTRLDLAEELPKVRVDVEQIRQVLINLVRNAVQAMETGGELAISTNVRERQDVFGAMRRWVEMHIIDTGPGIPQRVLQNLFVPFVTTKDRGTGLGLAISQRIVTAAGGSIDVRSAAGRGTTFVVSLPASDDIPASVPPPALAEGKADQGALVPPSPSASSPGSPPDGDAAPSETATGIATSR